MKKERKAARSAQGVQSAQTGPIPPAATGVGAGFPFCAVVGQEELRLALVLAALDPAIGGVLLRGQKGSAKTTLARGLAALLAGGAPFVELPVGTSEDRLTGSLDLRVALTEGRRHFVPGLLAGAHGGVLYVDEVNLLPDHLVDLLLDVASSGVNRVERDGVSHVHPSRFVLVGSMNPEEGELRPQLLDRFGLAVDVTAPTDPTVRAEAVSRRLAFDADRVAFADEWHEKQQRTRRQLAAARPAPLAEGLLAQVAALCAASGAEGLRADLVVCRAASALAGWEGRPEATAEDVRRVAGLALAHRRRRSPFEAPGMADEELRSLLDDALGTPDARPPGTGEGSGQDGREPGGADGPNSRSSPSGPDGSLAEPPGGEGPGDERGPSEPGPGGQGGAGATAREEVFAAGTPARGLPVLLTPGPNVTAATAVRGRSAAATRTPGGIRGRQVGARVPDGSGPLGRLAVDATVTASVGRRAGVPPGSALLETGDLREMVTAQPRASLVVLAVDASGSMGAEGRMSAAKGAVLALLLDAYQRRDRVALVAFRGVGAEVLLRPTGSTEVAESRLQALPTGGRTPLAAGIFTATQVAKSAGETHCPLLVLVTDGRATAGLADGDPMADALQAAEQVRHSGIASVVVDAEGTDGTSGIRLGLARSLAEAMGARHLAMGELTADTLAGAVIAMLPTSAMRR